MTREATLYLDPTCLVSEILLIRSPPLAYRARLVRYVVRHVCETHSGGRLKNLREGILQGRRWWRAFSSLSAVSSLAISMRHVANKIYADGR